MVFSSILFLLYFLPIFLLVYHVLRDKFKNYFILFASIFFYAWGAPKFIFVLIASTILDYYLVKWMHHSDSPRNKKILLTVSISLNVGLLLFFKYANFAVENTNFFLDYFGKNAIEWTAIALPIGISFYTFQTLTYSIDVYRGTHKPLTRVSNYLVYIMSFPQMIAGPIVRFNDIADQIIERKETTDDKLLGLYRFCIGLGKKVLIANALGAQADAIFSLPIDEVSFIGSWVGILAYTFQIYFDFSGYSDMAIGLGRMMGFTFPENFNSPYTSGSISEFWRRWHITLGRWMRDYLYIPLGGNRVSSPMRLYFNLWLVFLVSGFWHGASWNFLIWGAFHGLFLILDRLFMLRILQSLGKVPAGIITFLIVVVGWVFFRIEDFDSATAYLSKMVHFTGFNTNETLVPGLCFYLCLALFLSIFGESTLGQKLQAEYLFCETLTRKTLFRGMGISIVLFVLSVAAITASEFNPFIYFRF